MSKVSEELRKQLKENNLIFDEFDSRMNYGMIGHLKDTDSKLKVIIFPSCFYVHDKEFPINVNHLPIIQTIQLEFKELSRDDKNRIITFEN